MNKKLVEVRQRPDPPKAEEADRRAGPDPRDQPGEVLALSQSDPALLREPLEGARQDEAGPRNEIVFSQHEMGSEIMSSPALEQGRNRRAEFVEEVTELKALLCV